MRLLLITLIAALTAACANPYRSNFNSIQDRYPQWLESRLAPKAAAPDVVQTDDIQKEGWGLVEKGYVMIGFSRFDLPQISIDLAISEGKTRGADIVLVQKRFSKSLTETVTMTQWGPTETTEYREDTGISGDRGTRRVDRRVSVTTTRGPETVYVPQQVDYYEHSATYWRKVERTLFGAVVQDLTDEQKARLQTNRGLSVRALVTDSPAFQADLLKGDIILKIDGQQVPSAQKFYEGLIQKAGQDVKLSILRNDKTIEKTVRLNP